MRDKKPVMVYLSSGSISALRDLAVDLGLVSTKGCRVGEGNVSALISEFAETQAIIVKAKREDEK